jgi:hypothetical protein
MSYAIGGKIAATTDEPVLYLPISNQAASRAGERFHCFGSMKHGACVHLREYNSHCGGKLGGDINYCLA